MCNPMCFYLAVLAHRYMLPSRLVALATPFLPPLCRPPSRPPALPPSITPSPLSPLCPMAALTGTILPCLLGWGLMALANDAGTLEGFVSLTRACDCDHSLCTPLHSSRRVALLGDCR